MDDNINTGANVTTIYPSLITNASLRSITTNTNTFCCEEKLNELENQQNKRYKQIINELNNLYDLYDTLQNNYNLLIKNSNYDLISSSCQNCKESEIIKESGPEIEYCQCYHDKMN